MKLIPRRSEVYAEPLRSSTIVTVESNKKDKSPFDMTAKGMFKVVRCGPDVENTEEGDLIMVPDRTFLRTARGIMVEEKYITCNVVKSDEFDETKPYPIAVPQMEPLTDEQADALALKVPLQAN